MIFMSGLIIQEPWIDLILEGKKDWEIRGRKTKKREKIKLIKKGSGLIVGEADLVDCECLTIKELKKEHNHHQIDDLSKFNYKNYYAWKLKNITKYKKAKHYNHPRGAVVWVNNL